MEHSLPEGWGMTWTDDRNGGWFVGWMEWAAAALWGGGDERGVEARE